VKANRAAWKVATMCRVLGVSTSGFYAWLDRAPSARAQADARLSDQIQAVHQRSRATYGMPRVHAELTEQGLRVGGKRVARLMKAARAPRGVASQMGQHHRARCQRTPGSGSGAAPLQCHGPDALWVADITYIPTWAGFLYLAVVLDAFSRRVVGWAMQTHLRAELVLQALEMAYGQRRPDQVVHHSDQGTQYTSIAFGARCREMNVRPSTGSVGDCFDNAMAESFFATLECELLDRRRFKTQAEAEIAVFDFIEGWYNPQRRHSSLGYLSPVQFEKRHATVA